WWQPQFAILQLELKLVTAVKPRYNSPSRLPHSRLAFDGTPQTGSRRPVSSNGLLFRRDDSPWRCPAHWKSRRNSRLSLLTTDTCRPRPPVPPPDRDNP